MPFSKLGLSPMLVAPLARMGYGEPTPVQAASIPLILTGTDLLARAQTGTGKTAAFGLPMIERLMIQAKRPRSSRPASRRSDRLRVGRCWAGAPDSRRDRAVDRKCERMGDSCGQLDSALGGAVRRER